MAGVRTARPPWSKGGALADTLEIGADQWYMGSSVIDARFLKQTK